MDVQYRTKQAGASKRSQEPQTRATLSADRLAWPAMKSSRGLVSSMQYNRSLSVLNRGKACRVSTNRPSFQLRPVSMVATAGRHRQRRQVLETRETMARDASSRDRKTRSATDVGSRPSTSQHEHTARKALSF